MYIPIINGFYKHFKGRFYKVIFIATDVETLKVSVVYESVEDKKRWIRSLEDWNSKPSDNESRFSFVGVDEQ